MKTLQDFPAMKSQAVARQIHRDSLGGVFLHAHAAGRIAGLPFAPGGARLRRAVPVTKSPLPKVGGSDFASNGGINRTFSCSSGRPQTSASASGWDSRNALSF